MMLTDMNQNSPCGQKLSFSFTKKLFDIVNDPRNRDIISWTNDGNSFEVRDPKLLEKNVLPQYFRHTRFQSLVRQLNFYSFKKVGKERSSWIYAHRYFKQGQPELLSKLKRKTNGAGNFPCDFLSGVSSALEGHSSIPDETLLIDQNSRSPSLVSSNLQCDVNNLSYTGSPVFLEISESDNYSPLCSLQLLSTVEVRNSRSAMSEFFRKYVPSSSAWKHNFSSSMLDSDDAFVADELSSRDSSSSSSNSVEPGPDSDCSCTDGSDVEGDSATDLENILFRYLSHTGLSISVVDRLIGFTRQTCGDFHDHGPCGRSYFVQFCSQALSFLKVHDDIALELMLYMQMLQFPVECLQLKSVSLDFASPRALLDRHVCDILSCFIQFTLNLLKMINEIYADLYDQSRLLNSFAKGIRVFCMELDRSISFLLLMHQGIRRYSFGDGVVANI